ncbi:hypothetical protein [Rhizobium leguminosarum]|jgi:hypothetical protein|uniref:hypothetical protein n=1 Tax=Rhizobium leguminosarum TaxID=384 RepID=UPI00102FC366|nr:hypothetical protein [Rhizobium leguminosarum]TAV82144.1 hypothetical protein ELI21_32800 [Rhizobium leguminosarum]TAV83125.1 hypothetical protein ELI22_29895 [Rhizobium leguminosarum]TAW25870.1 hypothetical protein ELI23_31410 [Rhizobium leguminosarum]TAX23229.1 hypothetical protein ELI04_30265 [Rhizobium leguminosarum]TAY26256.1 hypothetical protein ELH93_29760 [Rhizobium leguminosarum]
MANAQIASEARMSDVEQGPEKLLPCHRYRQDKIPPNLWINCGLRACSKNENGAFVALFQAYPDAPYSAAISA